MSWSALIDNECLLFHIKFHINILIIKQNKAKYIIKK